MRRTALALAGVEIGVGAHARIEGCSVHTCGVGVRCGSTGGGSLVQLSRVHGNKADGLELLQGAALDVRMCRVYENGCAGVSVAAGASGSFVRNDLHANKGVQVSECSSKCPSACPSEKPGPAHNP